MSKMFSNYFHFTPVKTVEIDEVGVPQIPSEAVPQIGNITVNGTVEKVEGEADKLLTDDNNGTTVVKVPDSSVDDEVEALKARIRELEESDVQVATTAEPPVVEELDNFGKIKQAVQDIWDGDDEDVDDDDNVDDKKEHHFWEWR